ncbi:hypothetical protein LINGRAHAP2_LOCUS33230 [Linum grandiflorum]
MKNTFAVPNSQLYEKILLATAALSLTYAAYKFGEGVKPGTYRLGLLAKFADYLAFAVIAMIAIDADDYQYSVRVIFGLVGFMWEFHSLMKLGWNFLDYTFREMMYDTFCIGMALFGSSGRCPPPLDLYCKIVGMLLILVFYGWPKPLLHLKSLDTVEDHHCVMCDLAMERYPEKVVRLLEGSV